MDKDIFIRGICEKKIMLFGAGNYAKQFYKDYRHILHIFSCMSNNVKEKSFTIENEEICPVIRAADYHKLDNEYIIICAADTESMKTQLTDMGYIYGRDYIESSLFRVLKGNRKIALFYGLCYVRAINICLLHSEKFTDDYDSWHFLDYVKMNAYEEFFFQTLLVNCDIFIYNMYSSIEGIRKNKVILDRLKPTCITISIPVYNFHGFHPNFINQPVRQNRYCIVSSKTRYSPFYHDDFNINRMIDEGKDIQEIRKKLNDEDFYSEDKLITNLKMSLKQIALLERSCDIGIYDFVVKNMRMKRLFLDETHISNIVIMEICKQLLGKIGISDKLDDVSVENEMLLYTSEIPIYPSVIQKLDLEIYKGKPTYKLFTFFGYKNITFDEYIDQYVDFCLTMKGYIEKGFFPTV